MADCFVFAFSLFVVEVRFLEFLNLDVDLYIQHLQYKNRATFDLNSLRDMIKTHRASAAAMVDRIPASVNIGLFTVNLGDIRNVLSKKHTEVSQGGELWCVSVCLCA